MKTDIWIPAAWMTTIYYFHVLIGPVPEGGVVSILVSPLVSARTRRGIFHGTKPSTISSALE